MLEALISLRPVLDAGGRLVDVEIVDTNRAARDRWFSGAAPESLKGRLLFATRPDLRSALLPLHAALVQDAVPIRLIRDLPGLSSGSGPVEVSLSPLADGFIQATRDVPPVARDASRQRTVEEYRRLAENASDIVLESDPAGVLSWVSPSVTAELGWNPDELIGTGWRDLIHPDDLSALARRQGSLQETGAGHVEARVRRTDGSYRRFRSSIHVMTDEDGRETGRIAGWQALDEDARAELLAAPDMGPLFGAWRSSDLHDGAPLLNTEGAEVEGASRTD